MIRQKATALIALLASGIVATASGQPSVSDIARWKRQAQNVTIIRDDWGIAHIYGKTDADAVFGTLYAQAEDDFNRVETNYINSMGRLAEAEGESAIYKDLRMKLFIDPDSMKAMYASSPAWLRKLMNAYADGLNYYLYKNPKVKPRVIRRFEPWMALTFSEGSIGGDIEKVNLRPLEEFYAHAASASFPSESERSEETGGSNGFRHRAVEHRRTSRTFSDQSTHELFLPLGITDGEQRRAGCVRRCHMGTVLRVSGIQRPSWMDAHLERCRRCGRVPRDHHQERGSLFLQVWRR
jgi:acyl-homoserine lactone acylase PvdQ